MSFIQLHTELRAVGNNSDETMKIGDLYKCFWKCRDLEIEHYWHRMVFMTAFLLACFAGYGGLLVAVIGLEGQKIPFVVANGMLFAVTMAGIVISCLWLMMSKGSKAWYEEYEHLISAFQETVRGKLDDSQKPFLTMDYYSIDGMTKADTNDFLWSTKAGGYSVSKVGIAVGHVSVVIWIVLAVLHCWLVRETSDWTTAGQLLAEQFFTPPYMPCYAGLVLLGFWVYVKLCLMSGYFERYK